MRPSDQDKACQKQILELDQFCKDTCTNKRSMEIDGYTFNIYEDGLRHSMRVRLSSKRDLFMLKLKYGERCS